MYVCNGITLPEWYIHMSLPVALLVSNIKFNEFHKYIDPSMVSYCYYYSSYCALVFGICIILVLIKVPIVEAHW